MDDLIKSLEKQIKALMEQRNRLIAKQQKAAQQIKTLVSKLKVIEHEHDE